MGEEVDITVNVYYLDATDEDPVLTGGANEEVDGLYVGQLPRNAVYDRGIKVEFIAYGLWSGNANLKGYYEFQPLESLTEPLDPYTVANIYYQPAINPTRIELTTQ